MFVSNFLQMLVSPLKWPGMIAAVVSDKCRIMGAKTSSAAHVMAERVSKLFASRKPQEVAVQEEKPVESESQRSFFGTLRTRSAESVMAAARFARIIKR